MGTPTVQSWPGLAQMPDNKQSFPKWQPADLRKLLPEMDERGLYLLNSMLQIDPERRISGPSLFFVSSTFSSLSRKLAEAEIQTSFLRVQPNRP